MPVGLEGWYEYKNAEYKRKKSILALSMMPGIKSLKDEIAKLDDGEEGVKKADIKNIGFSVKADGSVLFFAELEKSSTDQKKRIKHAREDKKAQKKEEEKGAKAKKT